MQDANKPSQSAQKLVKLDLSIQVQLKVNGIHSVIDKFGKDARILTAPKDATYVHSRNTTSSATRNSPRSTNGQN